MTTPNPEAALNDALTTLRRERVGKVAETFWISGLGLCPRKVFADRLGLPLTNPPDKRAEFKMWTGMHLGGGLQKLLEAQGYLDPAWTEKRVTHLDYSGKVDGVTHTVEGDAVVEIKTCDDNAITRHGDFPQHYLWQGLAYCLATKIPHLIVFMLGKNQGLSKHQVFTLNEEWTAKIEKEMRRMMSLWRLYQLHHILPTHEHRFSWEDRWCAMLDTEQSLVSEELKEVADV